MTRATMTRRHFKLIADALRDSHADERVVNEMANSLASTNPRFNRERFVEAATAKQTVTLVAPDGRRAAVECVADGTFQHDGKTVRVFTAR